MTVVYQKERQMKRIAIAVVLASGVVAVPAVVGADSGGQTSSDGPYAEAHNVDSSLGPLYGPVKAGPPSSTSYGYIAR